MFWLELTREIHIELGDARITRVTSLTGNRKHIPSFTPSTWMKIVCLCKRKQREADVSYRFPKQFSLRVQYFDFFSTFIAVFT